MFLVIVSRHKRHLAEALGTVFGKPSPELEADFSTGMSIQIKHRKIEWNCANLFRISIHRCLYVMPLSCRE